MIGLPAYDYHRHSRLLLQLSVLYTSLSTLIRLRDTLLIFYVIGCGDELLTNLARTFMSEGLFCTLGEHAILQHIHFFSLLKNCPVFSWTIRTLYLLLLGVSTHSDRVQWGPQMCATEDVLGLGVHGSTCVWLYLSLCVASGVHSLPMI